MPLYNQPLFIITFATRQQLYMCLKSPKERKKLQICEYFTNLQLFISLSGYQDSNLGPPAPKAGALTGLRYTPKALFSKAMQRYNFFLCWQVFLLKFCKKMMFFLVLVIFYGEKSAKQNNNY